MIIVDAVVWATALADPGASGAACRDHLTQDPEWLGPSHLPTEVLRTLSRLERAGRLNATEATALARDVAEREVRYVGPVPWLLVAQWQLRHNVSAYDAAYVSLGQRFDVPLVTLDLRLARAATALGVVVRTVERG